jgi:ribose/xylose/arabinose/galactoside ABC-type transport system permease subunit
LPAAPEVPFAPTPVELNNAFDDPQHGEPGRDRFGVHAIIEIVLLLAAAGLVVAVNQKSHLDSFGIRGLLALVTVYGLLGVGAGLSLRAGAVNLALGPIMVASALYFGQQRAHHNWYVAGGLALALAAGIGLVIALIVAIFQVPGWAVSLTAFVGVSVWISHLPAEVRLVDVPDPVSHAYEIFGVFAIVAVVGAMIGAIRSVRRGVGRFRPVSDPADRRGAGAVFMVGAASVVSSVLAALAGILYSMTTGGAVTDTGITWSAVAVAIALAGGTSAYGRRGGIFGTVLAAMVFVLVSQYSNLADYRIDTRVLIGSALVIGLLATRLVETYGRPHRAYDEGSTSRWLGRPGSQWPGDDEAIRSAATPAGEPERPHADWVESSGEGWADR